MVRSLLSRIFFQYRLPSKSLFSAMLRTYVVSLLPNRAILSEKEHWRQWWTAIEEG